MGHLNGPPLPENLSQVILACVELTVKATHRTWQALYPQRHLPQPASLLLSRQIFRT